MLMPKRVKRRKQFRGSMKGKALRGNKINYGEFGLVALEPCWIKSNQIEAARIAMTRYIKRGGKVWIKIFPDKPVTAQPAETRMGSGKGRRRVLGGSRQTGQSDVRDGGRERGRGARGDAPCRTQAACQVQVCKEGGRTRRENGRRR